jgi:hypothetical protein
MALVVPTLSMGRSQLETQNLVKGQLYNMDLNQKLWFQFNPTFFEWERGFNWVDIAFYGDETGGDADFISTGARTFELVLLYMADPGSPEILSEGVPYNVKGGGINMDFQAIRANLELWESKLPNKGRPSRIKVIVGPNSFECLIRSSKFRITEFFRDLTAREVEITLRFREWTLGSKEGDGKIYSGAAWG